MHLDAAQILDVNISGQKGHYAQTIFFTLEVVKLTTPDMQFDGISFTDSKIIKWKVLIQPKGKLSWK